MTPEQLIGENVKKARGERSQEWLGQALGQVLGRAWSRQAVSAAEAGRRDFRALDLVALSFVLERPVSWFFTPIDPNQRLKLGSREVTADQFIAAFGAHPMQSLDPIANTATHIRDLVRDAGERIGETASWLDQAARLAESIEDMSGKFEVVKKQLRRARGKPTRHRSGRGKK